MPASVTITRMEEKYIASFWQALDAVARERRYLAFLEGPPFEQTKTFVLGLIADGSPQFVALAGDEVVGWCDMERHSRPIHAHGGALGMGIIPAYRGKGLGLQLITTTLAAAREAGFVRIALTVRADNARAISLYQKVGFVREGVERDAICIDGIYSDVIRMGLINQDNKR